MDIKVFISALQAIAELDISKNKPFFILDRVGDY